MGGVPPLHGRKAGCLPDLELPHSTAMHNFQKQQQQQGSNRRPMRADDVTALVVVLRPIWESEDESEASADGSSSATNGMGSVFWQMARGLVAGRGGSSS